MRFLNSAYTPLSSITFFSKVWAKLEFPLMDSPFFCVPTSHRCGILHLLACYNTDEYHTPTTTKLLAHTVFRRNAVGGHIDHK